LEEQTVVSDYCTTNITPKYKRKEEEEEEEEAKYPHPI